MPTYNCDANIAALNEHLAQQEQFENQELKKEEIIAELLADDCKEIINRMLCDDACGVHFGMQDFDTINGFDAIARFAIATILSSDEPSIQTANRIIRTAFEDAAWRIADSEAQS